MEKLIRIGATTINLDNVTEIVDDDTTLSVIYLAAWEGDDDRANRSAHIFRDDEAAMLRAYLKSRAFSIDNWYHKQ